MRILALLALLSLFPMALARQPAEPPSREAPPAPDILDAPAIALPDTPAGRQLDWAIRVLNGEEIGDIPTRFSKRFLEQVPPAKLKAAIADLRERVFKNQPVRPVELDGTSTDHTLSAFVVGGRRKMSAFVAVDDATGQISGLLFRPAFVRGGDGGGWKGLAVQLLESAPDVSMGAYEVVFQAPSGEPPPGASANPAAAQELGAPELIALHEIHPDRPLAIGSAFKLFVLGALAEQVEQGKGSWDEKLPIRDELKSLPSGVMQAYKPGSEFPVTFYAERMIAISDNTAADHLAARAGRENVEAYYARFAERPGHALPFLRTMEMFRLKLGDPQRLEDYARAGVEERRAMLGELGNAKPSLADIKSWDTPRAVDRVEWFASAPALARVMADLRTKGSRPGGQPVWDALTKNPGLKFDREIWKQVAFKGGSEPGVLNLTWLFERDDHRWFALVVTWNNRFEVLEEGGMIALADKGVELLAAHEHAPPRLPGASEGPAPKGP